MTGSEASDINQRLDAPTQASPSRLRNGRTVKQRSRTYKDMKNMKKDSEFFFMFFKFFKSFMSFFSCERWAFGLGPVATG
jgi:hypothetical protein